MIHKSMYIKVRSFNNCIISASKIYYNLMIIFEQGVIAFQRELSLQSTIGKIQLHKDQLPKEISDT